MIREKQRKVSAIYFLPAIRLLIFRIIITFFDQIALAMESLIL